jgi:hypothetical protein
LGEVALSVKDGTDPVAAICATLTGIASVNLLQLKMLDGLTWQGQIDALTPVHDIASALALRDRFRAFGVDLVPVVVPRGLAGEGELHGQLAAAFGCIVVDIENGAGFWDKAPAGEIPIYFRALRVAAGDGVQIVAQPDPRNTADVALDQCIPYLSGIAGQHYCGWSEVGWTDVATEVARYQQLAAFGLPMYPTLWGEAATGLAHTFWDAVRPLGALGCCAFALGPMTADELNAYAWFALPAVPQPPPAPKPVPTDGDFLAICAAAATRDLAGVAAAIAPFS